MICRLRPELPCLKHVVTLLATAEYPDTTRYEQLIDCDPADESSLPVIDPNSIKCRLYTSGTTGFPKAVLHSHNTLTRIIDNTSDHSGTNSTDVMMMPSPITHITGYSSGLNLPFIRDGRSALMERWNADQCIDFIHRVGGTMTVGATPFLQELLDAAERRNNPLPSMRVFSCGGAAVPPALVLRAYEVLENCRTVRVYGSTEAPIITLGWLNDPQLAATTDGHAYGYEVRIVDDEGAEVPDGEDGEITARGAGMFLGYADADQNAEAHTEDGFFHTGDIGRKTPEGAVLITDRKKDIIIRGGENISAKEIEDCLHLHPKVKEAAVVAMPHQRLGEGVCVFVILQTDSESLSLEEVAAFTNDQGLARQKIPERLEVVEDLPRTPSGKVRKDRLRVQLRDQ